MVPSRSKMISGRLVTIGGISAILASIAAYFMLQKTAITFHLEVFLETDPETVFDFVRDPNYFVEFTHEIKDITIQSNTTEDGAEKLNFIISHQIPHIGRHRVYAKSIVKHDHLKISYETVHFNGFLQGEFEYKFNKARHKEMDGTLLVENGKIVMPWLLRDFANKTTINQHTEILQNIKLITELRLSKD